MSRIAVIAAIPGVHGVRALGTDFVVGTRVRVTVPVRVRVAGWPGSAAAWWFLWERALRGEAFTRSF